MIGNTRDMSFNFIAKTHFFDFLHSQLMQNDQILSSFKFVSGLFNYFDNSQIILLLMP